MKQVKPNTPGARLRALRKAVNLDQEGLAAAIGFSRTYITKVELGDQVGGLPFWEAAAKEFGCSVDFLRHGTRQKSDPNAPKGSQGDNDADTEAVLAAWRQIRPSLRDLAISILRNMAGK